MTRYDPDGKEKRRAKKGETRCGDCKEYLPRYISGGYYGMDYDGEVRWFKRRILPASCMGDSGCRADDYAGDCTHSSWREQG